MSFILHGDHIRRFICSIPFWFAPVSNSSKSSCLTKTLILCCNRQPPAPRSMASSLRWMSNTSFSQRMYFALPHWQYGWTLYARADAPSQNDARWESACRLYPFSSGIPTLFLPLCVQSGSVRPFLEKTNKMCPTNFGTFELIFDCASKLMDYRVFTLRNRPSQTKTLCLLHIKNIAYHSLETTFLDNFNYYRKIRLFN